jgi:hypothetical protein
VTAAEINGGIIEHAATLRAIAASIVSVGRSLAESAVVWHHGSSTDTARMRADLDPAKGWDLGLGSGLMYANSRLVLAAELADRFPRVAQQLRLPGALNAPMLVVRHGDLCAVRVLDFRPSNWDRLTKKGQAL